MPKGFDTVIGDGGKQTPVNIQLVGETEVKPSGSTYKFKEPGA